MKNVLFSVLFSFFFSSSFAQFSAGAYAGLFHGFSNDFETQYGVNGTVKYDFDKIRIGGNIGYYVKSEDAPITKTSRYTTPLSLSAEYVFFQKDFYPEYRTVKPHAGLELGIYRTGIITSIGSSSTSSFGGGPTAGALMRFTEHLVFDAMLKYHLIFRQEGDLSAFSAKIGFLYYF